MVRVKHKLHGESPAGSEPSLLPELRIVNPTHSPLLDICRAGVGPLTFPYDKRRGSLHHENVCDPDKVRTRVNPQSRSLAARR